MKNLIFALPLVMMTRLAFAEDPSFFVCKVKSSTMKMYSSSPINVQLSDGVDDLRMDQGNNSLEAKSEKGNGRMEISSQNMFAHDEWNSGVIYLSLAVIDGEVGEITIVDQFTDGNERTVLTCSQSDEG